MKNIFDTIVEYNQILWLLTITTEFEVPAAGTGYFDETLGIFDSKNAAIDGMKRHIFHRGTDEECPGWSSYYDIEPRLLNSAFAPLDDHQDHEMWTQEVCDAMNKARNDSGPQRFRLDGKPMDTKKPIIPQNPLCECLNENEDDLPFGSERPCGRCGKPTPAVTPSGLGLTCCAD
jgi:hypothetical protein